MANPKMKKVKGDSYYGNRASNYETVRAKQPWWSVEQREMQALLDKLPKKLKVVDIPFGTGRFATYYIERGYKVYGLDASQAMLDTAKDILGDDYKKCKTSTGLSTSLPFKDDQFDLLVSTRFLRDIITYGDVKTTLKEFHRVTKSHAIIQLGWKLDAPFEMPPDDERMSSRMSQEQTYDVLREYGFDPKESRKVKGDRNNETEIHHILCEITGK